MRALASLGLVAVLAGPAYAGIAITRRADAVEVATGKAQFTLSTKAFDVVHAATFDGQPRLGPGRVLIDALGTQTRFGAPDGVTTGKDWVELRGWADAPKHLWYVARYQFFDGKPYTRLVLTLTDRHDSSPAPEPSDRYWQSRRWANWRLEVSAPGGKPQYLEQHNSYSCSSGGPWIEVVSATGSPYQWAPQDTGGGAMQLGHGAQNPANQIVWHPNIAGAAELTALVTPWTGGAAYHAAKAVTYEIVDGAGKTFKVSGDQRRDKIKLGTFTLGKNSVVRLLASGGGEEIALARALRVAPAGGAPFEVAVGVRCEGVISDGPITFALKDFWQHHPISMYRNANAVGWHAIKQLAEYSGGMGLTLETLIAIDGPRDAAVAALYAPPPRDVPLKLSPADGSRVKSAVGDRYDALLKTFAARHAQQLEQQDSFGWRNWGDYQIGTSYTDPKSGVQVEDWANGQYDLPSGLLVAWLRTGDPALWRYAQASVRHLMDLDLVKFEPFLDKLNGLVYRKGEMRRPRSHIDAEPITDQGFAFRSLLLYHQLTGEAWPKELAKQNIDRLVFYAQTRPHFVLNGGRPTAWMLRAALAGAEWFGDDKSHDYRKAADAIVGQLVDYYGSNKRLPGRQPVWQAQMIEGLAEYHRRTGRKDVADVISGTVRHLLTDGVRRKDGGLEFKYCYVDTPDCPMWTNEDNYAFLWLSAVAYAHKLTGDPFFARWSAELFAFGEAKMREHRDTRSWTSALAFPHWFVELSSHP